MSNKTALLVAYNILLDELNNTRAHLEEDYLDDPYYKELEEALWILQRMYVEERN